MRHIFLLAVVTLVACIFPNHPLSMGVYLGAILFAVVSGINIVRKASPAVQRQALFASLGALLVAVGVGTFVYLR
jgi:hypothetical protein